MNQDEKDFLLKFGHNVRIARNKKGLKQSDLANALDTDKSQISRLERGILSTSIYNIHRIAKILEVDVQEFFDFE